MSKNVVDVKLRASMELGEVSSGISQIQNQLKTLKLSPEVKRSFDQLFDEANADLDKVDKKLKSGFKTKGDITGFEKASSSLMSSFSKIENKLFKLYNLSEKDLIKLDPKLKSDIEAIEKKFENMGEAFPENIKNGLSGLNKVINGFVKDSQKKVGKEILAKVQNKDYSGALALAEKKKKAQETVAKNNPAAAATANAQKEVYKEIIEVLKEAINYQDQFNNKAKFLELEKAQRYYQTVDKIGSTLKNAQDTASKTSGGFQKISDEVRNTAEQTVSFNSELDSIKGSIKQFFSLANSIAVVRRILQDTIQTTKELDAAMTQTAVVTDFSIADMWKELPRYTEEAKKLGVTIKGVYETMTLYYQQGLKTNEVFEVGSETLKMARIAGLDYAKATDFMTAALRGFNMEVNELNAQKVNDVYSELAAITAADTQEIATAMTKTASIASSANMEFETTAAFLSQIIETTRESAETAGTAMKTVIARFTELKKDPAEIGEVDGEIVDANKIETALKTINVALRDSSGQFRNLDEVFLDISAKWNTLDTNTQRYIATMAAGSRQQSRFIAMMSDYDRTMELVSAANTSAGASQRQFDKTLESLDAKLNRLKDAWDQFSMGFANNKLIKAGVDTLTWIIDSLNKLISLLPDSVEGLGSLLAIIAGFKGGKKIFDAFSESTLKNFVNIFKETGKVGENAGVEVGVSFFEALRQQFKSEKVDDLFGNLQDKMAQARQKTAFKGFSEEDKIENVSIRKEAVSERIRETKEAWKKEQEKNLKEDYDIKTRRNREDDIRQAFRDQEIQQEKNTLEENLSNTRDKKKRRAIRDDFSKSKEERKRRYEEEDKEVANSRKNEDAKRTVKRKLKEEDHNNYLKNLELEESNLSQAQQKFADFSKLGLNDDQASLAVQKQINLEEIKKTAEQRIQNLYGKEALDNKKEELALMQKQVALEQLGLKEGDTAPEQKKSSWTDLFKKDGIKNKWKEFDKNTTEKLQGKLQKISEANNAADGAKSNLVNKGVSKISGLLSTGGLKALLIPLAKIAAIIAVIAVTVKVVSHLIETSEEKIKRLDTAIEHSAESMQEAKTALDDINSSMEQLTNSKNEFDGLIQGTDEWKKKLVEVNTQVLEILDKYPKLAQFLEQGQNGELSINNEGWDALIKEQQQKFASATLANTISKNQKEQPTLENKAREEMKKNQLIGAYGFNDLYEIAQKMARKGEFLTAGYESGDLLEQDILQSIKKQEEGIGGFNKIINMIKTSTLQTESLSNALADQFVAQNEDIAGTKYAQGISKLISSQIDIGANGELSDEVYKVLDEYGWFEKDGQVIYANKSKIWNEIATKEDISYKEAKEKYSSKDELYGAALELASEKAAKGLSDSADLIIKGLRKIGLETESISDEWADAFEALFSTGLTQTDIDALEAEEVKFEDLPPEIKEYFDNDSERYEDYINEQITSAKEDLKFAQGTLDTLGITELDTSKISAQSLKGLADKLNEVYYKSGEEGIAQISDSYNAIVKNLNKEDAEKFTAVLNGIDWNSVSSIEDLESNLKDLGLYVNDAELEDLTKDIVDFNKATRAVSLEELTTQLQNMQTLTKEIEGRERNDRTFTEEQKNQLLKAGISEDDFVGFGDSWQYVGASMDALTEAVKQNTIVTLEETQAKLAEDIKFAKMGSEYEANTGKDLSGYGVLDQAGRQALLADFLNNTEATEINGYSKEQLSTLTSGELSSSQENTLNQILQALADVVGKEETLQAQYDQNQRSLGYLQYSGQSTDKIADAAINGTLEEQSGATDALLEKASYYAELTDEIRAYHEAVKAANKEDVETAKKQLAVGIAIEKRAKELDDLDDKVEDHLEGLKKIKKGTGAYEEELDDLAENMNDAFDSDALTGKFFSRDNEKNLKLLEKAINGSQSAWDQLLQNIMIAEYKVGDFATKYGLMGDHVTNVTNALNGLSFNINGTADVTQLVASLFAAEMTGEEVAQFLEDLSLTNIQLEVDNNIKGIDSLADIKNWDKVAGGIKISATNVNIPAARRSSSFGGGGRNSGSKGGGGGGGGGSSEKWENPYDSFYNLNEDINELLDKRNKLESDYELLLQDENASIDDYLNSYKDRIESYKEEIGLQEEMLKMRKQEQDSILSRNSNLKKYAWVENGEVKINFNAINKVTDQDLGEKIEKYIEQLEENDEAIQEAEEAIQENTLAIEDLMDEWRDTAASFEERVYDALVWEREQEIEKMEEISSSLEESNSNLIDAIQEEINERRQQRENEETEKDLSEKERRLAYLQQDTSGAYDQEILNLQKEIEEGQEDYTDTLIDQKIEELEKQNDEAAKQREKQIKIAEYQLENDKNRGVIAQQTRQILQDANSNAGWNRVWRLLEKSEGFGSLTDTNKAVWTEDTQKEFKEAMAYLNGSKGGGIASDIKSSKSSSTYTYTPVSQNSSSGGDSSGGGGPSTTGPSTTVPSDITEEKSTGDEQNDNTITKEIVSTMSIGHKKYYFTTDGTWYRSIDVKDADKKKITIKKNTKSYNLPYSVSTLKGSYQIPPTKKYWTKTGAVKEGKKYLKRNEEYALTYGGKKYYYYDKVGGYVSLDSIVGVDGDNPFEADSYAQVANGSTILKPYKTGGLADFTGPAWLDGTKSKPELVLNQKDTQNFLQLKDVLGSFMKNKKTINNSTQNATTNFEISINVDKVSSDYDVDQIAGRVKQIINDDARYRNSNVISRLR